MSSSSSVAVIVPEDGGRGELCRETGLCPQCEDYGDLPARAGRSGAACPLCVGDACCPQCSGTRPPAAVGS